MSAIMTLRKRLFTANTAVAALAVLVIGAACARSGCAQDEFAADEGDAAVAAASDAADNSTGEESSDRRPIAQIVQDQGLAFGQNLLTALLIFLVGRWATKIATRLVQGLMERAKVDPMLVRFGSNIVYAALLTFVVIAALSELGVETTSLAAVMAAAGFAIGMALQGSLGNFASGVLMIILRPFDIGNFVEAGGTSGIVEEIQVFHTVLRTPDNRRVIVPNGEITGAVITNYSANPTRRIDLEIGCGYGDDLREVRSYLESVIAADERILADPEPFIAVGELGDNSVNFLVRPWVNSEDYFATKCDLTETIKLGFDERGFSIPYPSRDVYMHQAG